MAGLVRRFSQDKKKTVHSSLTAALEPGGTYALVYRSGFVPKKLQPLTYAKLSDPRLRGKIGVNIRQYYFWDAMYPKWSEEEIMRYVKTVIVPQKPRLYNGSGDGWEMLVRGEVWVNPVSNTHQYFARYQPKGVKNIAVAPDLAGVESGKPVALLKDAPHPNAAKLFLHWSPRTPAKQLFTNIVAGAIHTMTPTSSAAGSSSMAPSSTNIPMKSAKPRRGKMASRSCNCSAFRCRKDSHAVGRAARGATSARFCRVSASPTSSWSAPWRSSPISFLRRSFF